jgi:hypothetical protein
MNDGVGESAKKADTVAMEGNMTFGWLMKITSLRLAVSMAPFQKALMRYSDEGRPLKDVHWSPAVNAELPVCAATEDNNYVACGLTVANPNHIIIT